MADDRDTIDRNTIEGGFKPEDTVNGAGAAGAIEQQDVPTDDAESGGILGQETSRQTQETATGSMSADTAALGGGAIAGVVPAGDAGADIDAGSR